MTKVKKLRGGVTGAGFDVNPQNINEEGRPDAGYTWKDQFMKIAEQKRDRLTRREIAAESIWSKAEGGDVSAFKEIADRMEGKPKQDSNVKVTGNLSLTSILSKVDETEKEE